MRLISRALQLAWSTSSVKSLHHAANTACLLHAVFSIYFVFFSLYPPGLTASAKHRACCQPLASILLLHASYLLYLRRMSAWFRLEHQTLPARTCNVEAPSAAYALFRCVARSLSQERPTGRHRTHTDCWLHLVLLVHKLIGHPRRAGAARVDDLQRLVADLVRLGAVHASQPDLVAVVVARVSLVLLVVLFVVTQITSQTSARSFTVSVAAQDGPCGSLGRP